MKKIDWNSKLISSTVILLALVFNVNIGSASTKNYNDSAHIEGNNYGGVHHYHGGGLANQNLINYHEVDQQKYKDEAKYLRVFIKNQTSNNIDVLDVLEEKASCCERYIGLVEPNQVAGFVWQQDDGVFRLKGPQGRILVGTPMHRDPVECYVQQNYCLLEAGDITASTNAPPTVVQVFKKEGAFSQRSGLVNFIFSDKK